MALQWVEGLTDEIHNSTGDPHTQYPLDSEVLKKTGLTEWDEQAGDPSTPASTKWALYFKAGGLYYEDDTGTVVGPLSTGGGSAHDLLSATHSDTLASAVSEGSMLIGNSTPKWAEMAVGVNGQILITDGSGLGWKYISWLSDVTTSLAVDDAVMVYDQSQGANRKTTVDQFVNFCIAKASGVSGQQIVCATGASEGLSVKEESGGAQGNLLRIEDHQGNVIFGVLGGASSDHIFCGGANTDFVEIQPFFRVPEGSAPGTPTTGTGYVYATTAGFFYKDDAGVATNLVSGGSGWDGKDAVSYSGKMIVAFEYDDGGDFQYAAPELIAGSGEGILSHAKFFTEPGEDTERSCAIDMAVPLGFDASSHTLTLEIEADLDTATNATSYIDIEARKGVHLDGSIPGDICTTGQQAVTTTTGIEQFTITPTGLSGGDLLAIRLKPRLMDGGGGGGQKAMRISRMSLVAA